MAPRPQDSYGSINVNNSIDEESVPLVVKNGHEKLFNKRLCWIGTSLFFVVGLIVMRIKQQNGRVDSFNVPVAPLSGSPVEMNLLYTNRRQDASPSGIWGNISGPLPTNSWYLNLVSHRAAYQPDDSTRVYTVPYIIDTAAANEMAGLRTHWPVVSANTNNVQMVDDFKNGITVGTTDKDVSPKYKVDDKEKLSPLGVSLKWGNHTDKRMTTHIVRGMPFSTVQYFGGVLPSVYSYNGPASAVLVDNIKELKCGVMKGESGSTAEVENEVRLHFVNSDFTWALFFSRPVKISCDVSEGDEKTRQFQLDVVSYKESENGEPLTVRLALLDQCTTGKSDIKQHCLDKAAWKNQKEYVQLLKESASIYPSSPQIDFEYPKSEEEEAKMTIDWGARTTTQEDEADKSKLLMFALPHHQDSLNSRHVTDQCINTFHGSTCLVSGEKWVLSEDLGSPMSFTAPRPPEPDSIPALADALSEDIQYRLSSNMLRGAADTYFSGKILARLGRVIMIATEMKQLADHDVDGVYSDVDDESLSLSMEAAASAELPSDEDIANAVEQLKQAVEIWLNGKAEAPYVYDKSWGGLVNCGCTYHGKGENGVCNNTFPKCPALADVNEDFGNGYYNDHHFHYGYHLYAAAVASKFDSEWAQEYFERVLLYIRDFANPSPNDEFFCQFRQKDWFLGSSWASGIVSAENSPHGRNQESSSEAIAAYEAVALYGSVMVDVFSSSGDNEKLDAAKLVMNAGQLLTSTELHATNRYWHVWSSANHTNTYPPAYKQPVVGMLYETMASFQTWFSPEPVVSYGIQLLPFTPVAERRDDPEWAAELYPLYDKACLSAGDFCVDNGWSIIQAGLCATAGSRQEALEQAMAVPTKVFASDGGVGNSLTNTIWYVATRPVS